MKNANRTFWPIIFLMLLLSLLIASCFAGQPIFGTRKQYTTPELERPAVNVPFNMRQANWMGNRRQGSCVHASLVTLLRWQGRNGTADYWKRSNGNGAGPWGTADKLDRANIKYAYVLDGDVDFLEWACSTRRGVNITVMGGRHMVTLVHLDAEWAAILDNNNISKFKWIPREALIAEWQSSYGWAITPVYSPPAPLP